MYADAMIIIFCQTLGDMVCCSLRAALTEKVSDQGVIFGVPGDSILIVTCEPIFG